ncbi:hypothetical protein [Parabacteroides sp. PF5-6]|uniref:hypothetical protein n=1 Tax=Parabacteroides sp. PF5-6 TaxID=1742403 RepID=UPI00240511D7|nr:hypothetical protein [Parabacteroides sp. PF5-6]MDF9829300.1 hypothetical protein [Parabacteroides sp. PF5-6]
MNTNREEDYLQGLFRQLPVEPLPVDFRMQLMQQIQEEALRVKKRNERLSWAALIIASLVILTLGVLAVIRLGIPKISIDISMEAMQTIPFYLYIAGLAGLLLFADHYFRKRYRAKHKDDMIIH